MPMARGTRHAVGAGDAVVVVVVVVVAEGEFESAASAARVNGGATGKSFACAGSDDGLYGGIGVALGQVLCQVQTGGVA